MALFRDSLLVQRVFHAFCETGSNLVFWVELKQVLTALSGTDLEQQLKGTRRGAATRRSASGTHAASWCARSLCLLMSRSRIPNVQCRWSGHQRSDDAQSVASRVQGHLPYHEQTSTPRLLACLLARSNPFFCAVPTKIACAVAFTQLDRPFNSQQNLDEFVDKLYGRMRAQGAELLDFREYKNLAHANQTMCSLFTIGCSLPDGAEAVPATATAVSSAPSSGSSGATAAAGSRASADATVPARRLSNAEPVAKPPAAATTTTTTTQIGRAHV